MQGLLPVCVVRCCNVYYQYVGSDYARFTGSVVRFIISMCGEVM